VIDTVGNLVGIISLEDINRTLSRWQNYPNSASTTENHGSQTLMDICTKEILYAWEDEPLSEALDRMSLRGLHQLPVVARDNPDFILGLLESEQVGLTCNLAATRQALRHYLPILPSTDQVINH
jgi:CBS domain-containing protein